MNSFPNILINRARSCKLLCTNQLPEINTLHDALFALCFVRDQSIIKNNTYEPCVFIRGASWSKINTAILEIIVQNKEIQRKVEWIYKNIILMLNADYTPTTDVKIRIALSMLAPLIPSKDLYILICNNVIDNIKELQLALLDEDLPFLAGPYLYKKLCSITIWDMSSDSYVSDRLITGTKYVDYEES